MNWMELVSSLVGSLTWPLVVVWIGWLMRGKLGELLDGLRISRAKIGPAGAEVDFQGPLADASAEIEPAPDGASSLTFEDKSERERWLALAATDPSAAVLSSAIALERALRELLGDELEGRMSMTAMARLATKRYWLSDEFALGVADLAKVRNSVAHGVGSISAAESRWFVDLAIALLVLLRGDPPLRQNDSRQDDL